MRLKVDRRAHFLKRRISSRPPNKDQLKPRSGKKLMLDFGPTRFSQRRFQQLSRTGLTNRILQRDPFGSERESVDKRLRPPNRKHDENLR